MTVTLSRADALSRICGWVEERYADTRLCGGPGLPTMPLCVEEYGRPDLLRTKAAQGAADCPARADAWRHIAHHIREEGKGGGEQRWTLVALWLLAPRLRGAARAIARRTGAEHADVCSALLVGALEGMRSVGEADPLEAERHLMDAAFAVGWRTGRRSPHERPTAEWDMARGPAAEAEVRSAMAESDTVVPVDVMSSRLAQQAQGERLGSLAYRLGLLPHVRQVRQDRRAGRCPGRGDTPREPDVQQGLFEMREEENDASS
ncbi:hypothetical protein OG413_09780 [Streptomyces sp. NBC_01433]|uniref:hypothetical protein n=1 Tax=Streptomyces sp. NBC_01433 TaxID=2903864 RepID=UPI00224FA608|nr:hypothetical protein [Streptomyces sp. NBC_01433]MCX4675594.1 hypothetical protein [Streptomyces sp. NBC_01433]